jgi:hypothetical protein
MPLLQSVIFLALAILSLRGVRSAYVAFILAAALYYPVSVDFQLNPRPCELSVDSSVVRFALRDLERIGLAAVFFLMSWAQFRASAESALVRAGVATFLMAALLEAAQSVIGHACRLSDLAPVFPGVAVGAVVASIWNRVWQSWTGRQLR